MLECRWPCARNAVELLAHPLGDRRVTSLAQRDRGDGQVAAALGRLAHHPLDVGADVRREVGLVDHEQVGAGDARAALARDVVAGRRRRSRRSARRRARARRSRSGCRRRSRRRRGRAGRWRPRAPRPPRGSREMSSRIAVCGQPPVCTAVIRSAGSTPVRAQELGVLGRVDVVGHDAEARPRRRARRTARRSGCSCRSRRGRRRRSAVRVQLAKRRSLCSRWMGAESSSATAAGAGSGAVVGGDRARGAAPSAGASSASQRAVTAGSSGSSFSAARRDRRRVVVEREQRRVLVGDARRPRRRRRARSGAAWPRRAR